MGRKNRPSAGVSIGAVVETRAFVSVLEVSILS